MKKVRKEADRRSARREYDRGGCRPPSSPAAPGSSARTSATTCSQQGHRVDLRRQPRDRARSRTSPTCATTRSLSSTTTSSSRSTIDGPVDYVFHLAALASPVDYLRAPLASLKVGSYGTHNALGLAKWKRARFLISSTSEVYGDPQVHPQPETYWGNVNPIGPRGVYDEAKRYAEALTMTYHAQQGVDTCIARIFNTYGPRMRRNDGRASVNFLNQALEGKPLTVYGDGSQTRSLCYVDDLIRGLYLLATSEEHLPVNIGNPDHEVTMLELAQTVIRVTRLERARSCSRRSRSTIRRCGARTSRAPAQMLGWAPEIDLEEGLRRWVKALGREPVEV